jgi:transposase
MNSQDIISLGLGLEAPWKITGQILDTEKVPHELRLTIGADRGSLFPCPVCGRMCNAHDFRELTWRHLNFFQHHCLITAKVPRVDCEEHGIKQIEVPWARKGSRFTLLFEQAAMVLVREMPVLSAARIMGMSDKRLWRIVLYYVNEAVSGMKLGGLKAFSMDETGARRGHRYVTVFIDLDRKEKPVVFAVAGKGKDTLESFKKFLSSHGGKAENIAEVVTDMSGAFISGIRTHFINSTFTVDWFHVVQLFTKAVEEVRRAESKEVSMPKAARWAVLKSKKLTKTQCEALSGLCAMDLQTSKAWRIKEQLRWVRQAKTQQAAKWRLTWFLNLAQEWLDGEELLEPVRKAIRTVEKYRDNILARWSSGHNNGRIEALNGIFQAAKARARGYRNVETFISIIYLLAAPIQILTKST